MTKALPKFGLLLTAALVACAAVAIGAQANHGAVDIAPNNTAIEGTAVEPTLDYEGVPIVCDEGVATGTTGMDSDTVDVELTFSGNCNVNGLPANDIDCDGTATLHALNPTTNTGEVDRLNTGFLCEVVVPDVCTVTVAAQELPVDLDGDPGTTDPGDNQANLQNEGTANPDINAIVDVEASADNPTFCGPNDGIGGFTGLYDLDTAVTFDAP
jgi:hypothetical protein